MKQNINSVDSARYYERAKATGTQLLVIRTKHQEIEVMLTRDGVAQVKHGTIVSLGLFGKDPFKLKRSPSPGTG